MRLKEFLGLFVIVLLLGFASASFTLGTPSHDLQKSYDLGERIGGWINISFTDEPYNSSFTDSLGNVVALKELLDEDYTYIYNDTLPLVTSEMQKLSLDDFFLISVLGSQSYELNFTNSYLFTEQIIMNAPYNLTLKVQAANAIKNKKQEIEKFNLEKDGYYGFVKTRLDDLFNLTYFEVRLNELENSYPNAESDEDYQAIVDEINSMRIPKSISESNSINGLSFYPKSENIEFSILAGITGETYSELNSATYKNSLFAWTQNYMDTKINYKGFSASYGLSEENLFNYFEVNFATIPPELMDIYLIIRNMDGLEFEGDYGQRLMDGYYYINVKDIYYKDVVFITSENVDFTTLPMFVSPPLEKLPNDGEVVVDGKKEMKISKWFFFGLIILFVLVVGLVLYSIVSTWYDKKYEKYLFPNRNNLYNLIIFINNSHRKGINDEDIAKSLRKSKWSGEQIKYVMKKYSGKRTGMAKLPFNVLQKKPKKPDKSMHPGPMRGPTGNPPSTRNTSFRRPPGKGPRGSGMKR